MNIVETFKHALTLTDVNEFNEIYFYLLFEATLNIKQYTKLTRYFLDLNKGIRTINDLYNDHHILDYARRCNSLFITTLILIFNAKPKLITDPTGFIMSYFAVNYAYKKTLSSSEINELKSYLNILKCNRFPFGKCLTTFRLEIYKYKNPELNNYSNIVLGIK